MNLPPATVRKDTSIVRLCHGVQKRHALQSAMELPLEPAVWTPGRSSTLGEAPKKAHPWRLLPPCPRVEQRGRKKDRTRIMLTHHSGNSAIRNVLARYLLHCARNHCAVTYSKCFRLCTNYFFKGESLDVKASSPPIPCFC